MPVGGPPGQQITVARRAIIEFSEKHELADSIAELIAEQQAEDAQPEKAGGATA